MVYGGALAKNFRQISSIVYRGHGVLISSYVIADSKNDHPLITPDPPVLILFHGNKVPGFDGMLM